MAQTKVQLLQPDLGDVIDFDSSTLFMDGTDNRVGIRNTNPQYELDVTGTVNATNFRGNISVGTIDDWITHTGDTDTKFGFPAADTFAVETAGGERLSITSGGALNVPAGIGPQLRFENQHSVTTDAAISTFDDAAGTLLCLGSNFYFNSSGSETRYNTGEESCAITLNRNGYVSLKTGGTSATATTRFSIAPDGKVLMDNTDGTFTIGGDNVYDSAKINLMVGSSSQTSATTETTAIVIHDQNSRRNGTEGTGSWKSKITFRSTQINGNNQSEGASIVHDITYNNYSSTKMRSDLVFKTRGDAQTASSDAATEKLRIQHDGIVTSSATHPQIILKDPSSRQVSLRAPSTSYNAALGTDSTHDLIFYTNGYSNERLRITSAGEVRIGGDGGDGGYQLNVVDESNRTTTSETALLLYAKHDGSGTTGVGFGTGIRFWGDRASGNVEQNMGRIMCTADVNSGTTLSGALSFETSVGGVLYERFRIRSNGNAVINNSGGSVLEMTRTSTNTSGLCGKIVFGNTDWDSSMASVQSYQDGGNDNASLRFSTQASASGGEGERLRITKDGYIHAGNTGHGTNKVGGQGITGQDYDPYVKILANTSNHWLAQLRSDHTSGNGVFLRAGNSSSTYTLYATGYDENNAHLVVRGDGKVSVNHHDHHTSSTGILSVNATTSGAFGYKAIEIGTKLASGTDQGAIIVGRRKAASSTPTEILGYWDDGNNSILYHGGGWSSWSGSCTKQQFYTNDYTTNANAGSIRLSIGSKGQIYLNNRDSNNSSHRGNIIAYAPTGGEFSYKSLEIGSTAPVADDNGGLIVAQRKGSSAWPFALVGSWDDGSNCSMYYGGGWQSQSANATMHRFFTGSYTSSNGNNGSEILRITSGGQVNIGGDLAQTTHRFLVDNGTALFKSKIYVRESMGFNSTPFGANVVYDTGISVNASGYGGSMLCLCSRNYGAGTQTQAALYFLKFHYDGNNTPGVYYITGNSNFATFAQSGSNTLTVAMGASNNIFTVIESSV